MRKLLLMLMVFFTTGIAHAGDSINVPWEEFKKFYQESIENQIMERTKQDPFIYSINNVLYKITADAKGCSGVITLSGASISGEPEPINIFKENIIINNILAVSGGALLCDQKKEDRVTFYPKEASVFEIQLAFSLPVKEDNRSRFVSMEIPRALKNTLSVSLPEAMALIEAPGIKSDTGVYNFSSRSSFTLRFAGKKQTESATATKEADLSREYETVSTPPLTLESVFFFSSFEENGNMLSVLVMDIPPEAGPMLKVESLPDTDIWSLKVNGEKKNVYTSNKEIPDWIIPLDKGKISHIELALIQQKQKMGLHGRLETALPKIAFPSRNIYVAIAIPERVQLMSFEGALSPAQKGTVVAPPEFIGKPYYFKRSFYKGEGMKIAIAYKEPAK